MKKIILRLLIALIVLLVLAVVGIGLFLDTAVKKGVETVGPMVTKTDVKLQSVSLSLLSGSGKIKGLVVGNPPEFKTPSAISVGSASLMLQPKSIFSDKVVIKSIIIDAPEITYEQSLSGNNLSKLQSNLEGSSGGTSQPAQPTEAAAPKQSKPSKKLEVDEVLITGGKVHATISGLGGKTATLPLPDIRLDNLGTGPEGITPAELTQKVLQAVLNGAAKQGESAAQDLAKGAVYMGKEAATNTLDNVKKGLGNLFK